MCCYQCERRQLGCHSTCKEYAEAKQKFNEDKKAYQASLSPQIHKGAFLGDSGLCRYRPENYR